MLDYRKIAEFITARRKQLGLTQQEVAARLNISFQAVSKWENGTLPSIEVLSELAKLYRITVDELLNGQEQSDESFSYRKAGVDVSYTDAMKKEMAQYLRTEDPRVLNGLGPFASLYDIDFPQIQHPVLVLKSEEPGSKQKLAMEYGYTESICHDMINHLVNDICVMGAKPLAVLDTIVCGAAEKETIKSFVKGMSEACKENECALVGGETSIQPQVVDKGTYILTSSVAGIVSRNRIIDGSRVRQGDTLLAVASNGLHTNGYSLVRMLMDKMPQIKLDKIEGETLIEQIMKPHTPYYRAVKDIFDNEGVHGMAHITGGGIPGNLCRIIPEGLSAKVDLSEIRLLPLFKYLQRVGKLDEKEMTSTFNCGVGLVIVAASEQADAIRRSVGRFYDCYEIGRIEYGEEAVSLEGHLRY